MRYFEVFCVGAERLVRFTRSFLNYYYYECRDCRESTCTRKRNIIVSANLNGKLSFAGAPREKKKCTELIVLTTILLSDIIYYHHYRTQIYIKTVVSVKTAAVFCMISYNRFDF